MCGSIRASISRRGRPEAMAWRDRPDLDPDDEAHPARPRIDPEPLLRPTPPVLAPPPRRGWLSPLNRRSEEHTSALQSLRRRSYAVFCLKKKNTETAHGLTLYCRKRKKRNKKKKHK